MCDALDIDETTWHARVAEFQRDQDSYYRRITPELVIGRLDPMLEELVQKK